MPYIPEWVNLLPSPTPYRMVERPMTEALCHGCLRLVAQRLLARRDWLRYARAKKPGESNAIYAFLDHRIPKVLPPIPTDKVYDEALAFCGFPSIVAQKIKAHKKLAWIHTDYSAIDIHEELEQKTLEQFDNVVCVSEDARCRFLEKLPELADRTIVIDNILPEAYIRARAKEKVDNAGPLRTPGHINLLTIGRYCRPKRLEAIPAICRRLTEKGIDATWRIIGYGADDEYLRQAIAAEGMEQHVLLIGKQENPYPWIKACDWYVQPSLYEGKSITVREAQLLGKPVIITDYPTAHSQLSDKSPGYIVPMDIEPCANAMAELIVCS